MNQLDVFNELVSSTLINCNRYSYCRNIVFKNYKEVNYALTKSKWICNNVKDLVIDDKSNIKFKCNNM